MTAVFADIEQEFNAFVGSAVYATMVTVDAAHLAGNPNTSFS
ncbi:hypothetical protein ACFYSC_31930 [Streptosporangium sp. NPDC004379]